MKYNLAFIGFGNVGQGLATILADKKAMLKERYGFDFQVVAISDIKKGSIYNEAGLKLKEILRLARKTGTIEDYEGGRKDLSSIEIIEKSNADIVLEATWTNLENGEPGLTHIKKALENGKHVATTNKGPIALAYHELMRTAKAHNVFLRFEGTVMSGTPAINLALEDLAGAHVNTVRGIVNGTTNYILTRMEKGATYKGALEEAQRLGYAEADPTMDVEAWDPVAKIIILANVVMGGSLKVKDVEREGITKITLSDIKAAKKAGERIKLIAKAWRESGKVKAKVSPEKVPLTDVLAHIEGTLNALTFNTDVLGDVTVVGRGAGGIEAGYALLSDMLAIHRYLSGKVS
ncbi:MAG: homoserine dehydrogenase [Candidatus Bathyarchaeia archaeon]